MDSLKLSDIRLYHWHIVIFLPMPFWYPDIYISCSLSCLTVLCISYITCICCITTVIIRMLVVFLPVIFCHCEWDWSILPSCFPPTFLSPFLPSCTCSLWGCCIWAILVSERVWKSSLFCDSEWFTWGLVPPLCEWELNAIMHVKILDEWPACNKHWTNISYDVIWLDVNSRYQMFLAWVTNASLYKSRESKCPRAIISPSSLPLTPPPPWVSIIKTCCPNSRTSCVCFTVKLPGGRAEVWKRQVGPGARRGRKKRKGTHTLLTEVSIQTSA